MQAVIAWSAFCCRSAARPTCRAVRTATSRSGRSSTRNMNDAREYGSYSQGRGRRGGGRRGGYGRGGGGGDVGGRGRGGGGGGRRGGGGGGGRATWGNPEWRKAELARRAQEKGPALSNETISGVIQSFVNSNAEERVVPEVGSTADQIAMQTAVEAAGLYMMAYGKGASTQTVISRTPLARHRAEYDSKHLRVSSLQLQPATMHHVHGALNRFLQHFTSHSDLIGSGKEWRKRPLAMAGGPSKKTEACPEAAKQLKQQQEVYQSSSSAQSMMQFRAKLPSFHMRDDFLSALAAHQVVIVSGETGCGKTTQLPQFILEEAIAAGLGPATNIVCTQPRRISAISVAKRVAQERGESAGQTVGYRTRVQERVSPNTKLLFCTSGVLLRRLSIDRELSSVSHVIVDEIHERGVNEDLLLMALKQVLALRPNLKVILMSATLNADKFSAFYPGSKPVHIPGYTFPVNTHYLEHALKASGLPFPAVAKQDRKRFGGSNPRESRASPFDTLDMEAVAQGLDRPVADAMRAWWNIAEPESKKIGGKILNGDMCQFIANFLQWLHVAPGQPEGAILVFCTGWEDIMAIRDLLTKEQQAGRLQGAMVSPLHGQMDTADQQAIFDRPPPGQRKILLSTQIAETSITIEDVTVVVDCGLIKIQTYDALNKIRVLAPTWVSQANAKQRAGRSGRVQAGTCYRLYPEALFNVLDAYLAPEMQRMSLESVALTAKSIGVADVAQFLGTGMDPPEPSAIVNALSTLRALDAIDEHERLLPLGHHLVSLPVEPAIGRMLIMGAVFDCLDPVLTIAASLTYRSPFVLPVDSDARRRADDAKKELAYPHSSDHFALLNAYNKFRRLASSQQPGAVYRWCRDKFVAKDTMDLITVQRKELVYNLLDSGFLSRTGGMEPRQGGQRADLESIIKTNSGHAHEVCLIHAMLVAGLYPNIAALRCSGKRPPDCFTHEDGKLFIHPGSLVGSDFGERHEERFAVYTEKMLTQKLYMSTATLVRPAHLLLFGSGPSKSGRLAAVDGFLEFNSGPEEWQVLSDTRACLSKLLSAKLDNPGVDLTDASAPLIEATILLAEDGYPSRN